jgi:hypothetical protein
MTRSFFSIVTFIAVLLFAGVVRDARKYTPQTPL